MYIYIHIPAELIKSCDKKMKFLLSSVSTFLWDAINQLSLSNHFMCDSWPAELMETVLAYLSNRIGQLSSSQVRKFYSY